MSNTLIVDFRGVCTHFHHNFVPGIPHRVVLPNAQPLITGMLGVGETQNPTEPAWKIYALMPHVPMIAVSGDATPEFASVPALFGDNGYLRTPCRMHIINAIDDGLTYPSTPNDRTSVATSFMATVPQLTTFMPSYAPSVDVVERGRASAYFDIFSGAITAFTEGPDDQDIRVQVTIKTDGPPQLRVVPLTPNAQISTAVIFVLTPSDPSPTPDTEVTLRVGNIGACLDGVSNYDFLLHYLTSVTGVPRDIPFPLPGLGNENLCPTEKISELLGSLFLSGFPNNVPFTLQSGANDGIAAPRSEVSAACSDSRYP